MKPLDTDSGSLAGSESVAGRTSTSASQSSGSTRAVTARTTASHNIIATTNSKAVLKKNKGKGKPKEISSTAKPDTNLSDDDDSREREAALSSPIKGKTSRELNKVN